MNKTPLTKYVIFLSSTFLDLKEIRSQFISKIIKSGNLPLGMELFPTSDNGLWTTITNEIDYCDLYILIIGSRYGTLSNNEISFTEREFDYAVENNKKIFIFLPETQNFDNTEDGSLHEKLKLFRAKIQKNKEKYTPAYYTDFYSLIDEYYSSFQRFSQQNSENMSLGLIKKNRDYFTIVTEYETLKAEVAFLRLGIEIIWKDQDRENDYSEINSIHSKMELGLKVNLTEKDAKETLEKGFDVTLADKTIRPDELLVLKNFATSYNILPYYKELIKNKKYSGSIKNKSI